MLNHSIVLVLSLFIISSCHIQKNNIINRLDVLESPLVISSVGGSGDGGSHYIDLKTKDNKELTLVLDYRIESQDKGAIYLSSFNNSNNKLSNNELKTLKQMINNWLKSNEMDGGFIVRNLKLFLKKMQPLKK